MFLAEVRTHLLTWPFHFSAGHSVVDLCAPQKCVAVDEVTVVPQSTENTSMSVQDVLQSPKTRTTFVCGHTAVNGRDLAMRVRRAACLVEFRRFLFFRRLLVPDGGIVDVQGHFAAVSCVDHREPSPQLSCINQTTKYASDGTKTSGGRVAAL